ncbi:MAG: VIT domain-containing protein [Planctomycetaceae bacterium]
MKLQRIGLWILCLTLMASLAQAQGVLIEPDHHRLPRPWPTPTPQPVPTTEYKIGKLDIQATLKDQIARVQVSQTFVNTGSRQLETQFVFPLPYDGAIDSLTLLVDGKEFPAQLLSKADARAKYEAIVRSSKDPALLEWMGHGLFQTSVFPVPPGAERTVTINYNQLLRKENGVTDFLFPLSTARYSSKPVEKIAIQLNIESSLSIKNVYSPSHNIQVDKSDKKRARVHYSATNEVPTNDFRLLFDVNAKKLGTSVLSYRPQGGEEGFFLLLTSPQIPEQEQQLAKTVLFVVDKSGSMSGEKMEQARGALKFVLNNLTEGDVFNIIAYDSAVQSFRPELETFTDKSRKEALGFVDGLYAGGGTNIDGALATALTQLKDPNRPSFLIFLTDGLPTVGERNEAKIAASAKTANTSHARLLTFGVGYDVNSRLLDRLAREGFGASEYVRPNEDIEAAVAKVYGRIAAPVLAGVNLSFDFDDPNTKQSPPISRVYPSGTFDIFAGEQVVLVGRYRPSGTAKVTLTGKVGAETHTYDFPAEFAKAGSDQTYAFIEKLWAMRRVGEIIDELDLNGRNEELVNELVMLSTKHGILTPYTSFLADEQSRPTTLASSAEGRRNQMQAGKALSRLEEADGLAGVSQRSSKQEFKNAQNGAAPSPSSAPGRPAAPEVAASGGYGATYRDAATDETVVVSSVRQIGNTTLYKRGQVICTSETSGLLNASNDGIDFEKHGKDIVTVERFSSDYFALCSANTSEENRLLSNQMEGEQLLVQLRGKNYLIK